MEPITTAGLDAAPQPQSNPRRELIRGIRKILRNPAATEDEDVDALEALIEMSKD